MSQTNITTSADWAQKRKTRNRMIAGILAGWIALIFLVTLVRLGPAATQRVWPSEIDAQRPAATSADDAAPGGRVQP